MRLHVLLTCVLMGFSGVDLCFDSLVLRNYAHAPEADVLAVQGYYARTRDTYIVQVVTALLACTAISLLVSVALQRKTRDLLALAALTCLLPYFLLYMEPAEDRCVGLHAGDVPLDELRQGFVYIGIGHCLVVLVGSVMALLELELPWSVKAKKE